MKAPAATEGRRPSVTVRPRLRVGDVGDPAEREADAVAERVLRMPAGGGSRPCCAGQDEGATAAAAVEAGISARRGRGAPLPEGVRRFFEPRLAADLSGVRVHVDAGAGHLAARVQARAFTVGRDVFFGAGQWSPATGGGRRLLAHELAHTLQPPRPAHRPAIRRAVELRPPGRGEASAFDRRQELVDRLNATSAAVTYRLDADGRTLRFEIVDEGAMDGFDRQMTGFIEAAQVIPLRLITSAGRVQNAAGAFVPLSVDSFVSGYVDLDDLLGSTDIGFKLVLTHFITERLQVRDYARRIGTAGLQPLFTRAHRRGREAEAQLLQDLLGDPTVEHHFDELKPDGTTFVRAFRSRAEGYRVFYTLAGHGVRASLSITAVRVVVGGRRLTLEDFLAERAAAPAGGGR